MTNEEIHADVIIIDDDPMAGELTKDLLSDEGWKVVLIDDSTKAIDTIKKLKPKLVISDIMMPGIDGMEICKRIKTNPELKNIKVIILSGKSYEKEKQRALMLGAEHFITKPYNVENFAKLIKEILQGAQKPPSVPPPPPQKSQNQNSTFNKSDVEPSSVRLTLYGIRGLGSQLPQTTSKYGRQTICASIETSNDIFILDAGTGLYKLGKELTTTKKFYQTIWLFLTHFHNDNIIGLPYFEPLLYPDFNINIVGANDAEKALKDVIKSNLYSSFSPIPSTPKAKINLFEVKEENYEISPTIKMGTMYSNHPTTTVIYFFNINGIKIAFAPDSEIWEEATALQDYNERLGKFSSGFDVLLHDSYYNSSDYTSLHHKGHSSLTIVTKFAIRNKIRNLIPININPEYDDSKIDAMIEEANNIIKTTQSQTVLKVISEKESIIIKKS
ncbi:MAG: response regulator [Elusimicrobiales bacterium]|nr:response regulator [Elusimicrobiales bacterium]